MEVSLILPIMNNANDNLIEYKTYAFYFNMTCSEEYHMIAEDGKEHINTLWTVDINSTNQIKEIMMYKLDSTSPDVTYLKSKYKYALDGFGND